MPRMKGSAKPASRSSPRAAIAAPKLPDRPGRWKLLLRRRRNLLRPLAGLAVASVLLLMLIGSVHGLGQGLNFTERFGDITARMGLRVTQIDVLGQKKTPEPLLRAALGVSKGDPILTVSLAAARARIESIDWVQSATVERQLPGTIVVRIVERRPFAVWQNKGKFSLIDHAGKLVTDSDVATFFSQLPLVVGDGANTAAGTLIDALSAHPGLMERVVAAVRVGDRRWNLHLKSGTDVMLPEGADVQALAKLAELQASDALLDRPLERVDMRLPDRLVLRPYPEKAADGKPATKPAATPNPARKT
ncbi:MAG TPA: cell division protein FtsQ/DivIB [Acetobacteraceae bacterium]|jgi:cell division protein FtsQ|nr:cell division protein FtsQ/DivIB [Acetobacteraceae bacterium]